MRTLYQAILLVVVLTSCEFAPARPSAAPLTPVSSTLTSAPLPTPVSAGEQFERGLALRALGEYDTAAEQFHDLITNDPEDLLAPAATFYLAESFVLRERWVSAVAALEPIAAAQPATLYTARALFLLARSYEANANLEQAQAAYLRYAELQTPIAPYAQLRRAELLMQQGKPQDAARIFEAAATSPIVTGERAFAYERAIAAQLGAQKPEEALRLYAALLAFAQDPVYRARILLEAAATAAAVGDRRAIAWRSEIVQQSPLSPQAQHAADLLLADPQTHPDPEGLAAIYANAERWDDARTQFDAAIAGSAGEAQLDLRRRRALTLREGESPDYAAALAALDQVLSEAEPIGEVALQTRLDRIQTLGQAGDLMTAITQYRAFVSELPNDPRAPEALRRIAVLLERLNEPTAAAEAQAELARSYPDTVQGRDALFPAGLGFYRAGRISEAANIWEFQANQTAGLLAVQGAYWAGRAQREAGNQARAQTLLQRAILLAPGSYYAARAEDLLGRTRQGSVPIATPLQEQDWAALTQWVGRWAAPHAADQPVPTLAALLQSAEGPLARAQALDQVGLADEARSEWRASWQVAQDDPQQLLLVARIAYDQHRTHVVLDIAEQLFELAPVSARSTAPPALARLDMPTPYSGAVLAATAEQQVQPLLLYSLLRQESRFDPQIVSAADARGLAQVLPDTAQHIAERLQVADFREQDLMRPTLNIRFGAFYLGAQLREFDGNWYAALAAYNGGPSNALRWSNEASASDPDLFVEGIDYGETRNYVKVVYSNYAAYQRLYQHP